MRISEPRNTCFGSTRIEFLVLAVAIILLSLLVYVDLGRPQRVLSRTTCALNLKAIRQAEQGFEDDHGGVFPWMLPTDSGGTLESTHSANQIFRHYQILSNYLIVSAICVCPQDSRSAAIDFQSLTNANISYFISLNTEPKSPWYIVNGDRNISSGQGILFRVDDSSSLKWVKSVGLHGVRGHLVFVDGHVDEVDSDGLISAVKREQVKESLFAIP